MTWEDTHMATITAGDFRNGKTFEMDGKICLLYTSDAADEL